jgi:hypothetical protein
MSLTSSLVEEPADEAQLKLDLVADSRSLAPFLHLPKSRTEADLIAAGQASNRIDAAIDEMRDFLTEMHPESDAEALQSLRLAFPTVPLTERIAAIRSRFFA